jgi:hypothetical protein
MSHSFRDLAVDTFVPMLESLSKVLDKAAAHASAKKFDPAVLVSARLAPDMFPLSTQIQIACDHAKNGSGRLTGETPPRFEDNEKTIDELKARIAKTIDYVQGLRANVFDGGEERKITMPLIEGLEFHSNGFEYLRDWALPHFYFHVVTAYDILRHNGVEIGKRDYLAHTGAHIRPAVAKG